MSDSGSSQLASNRFREYKFIIASELNVVVEILANHSRLLEVCCHLLHPLRFATVDFTFQVCELADVVKLIIRFFYQLAVALGS